MKLVPSLLGQDSLQFILEKAADRWGMQELCLEHAAYLLYSQGTPTPSLCPITQGGQLFLGISGDAGATQEALRVFWLRVQALKAYRPLFKSQLHFYAE